MVLLIEGVECVGKTTLAEMLARDLGADILHFGVPPENAYEHFRDAILSARKRNTRLIVDRCHLSNRAYEGELGGGVLETHEWNWLDRDHFDYLILLSDNPFAIEERQRAKGDTRLTREQIGAIQARFNELLEVSEIPHKSSNRLTQFIDNGERTPLYEALVEFLKALK